LECCGTDNDVAPLFDYSLSAYPEYTNEEYTIFVPCPDGFTCTDDGIEITIPAGSITYRPTNSAANTTSNVNARLRAIAEERAKDQAYPVLNPQPAPPTPSGGGGAGLAKFFNTTQSFTAECDLPLHGPSVTKTVSAGTVASTVSLADANAAALAAAKAQAEAALVCYTYQNTEQTVNCPTGYTGTPVVVPAGTFFSNVSQAAANNLAIAYGESQISCTPTCPQTIIEALTWTPTFGAGGSASATDGLGSLVAPGNTTSQVLSNTLTNTCGVTVVFTITATISLNTKYICHNAGAAFAQIRGVVNGVNDTVTETWGGTDCVGCVECPCVASSVTQITNVVTVPAGQTIAFEIYVGHNNANGVGCPNSTLSFNITAA
jgi:hypothetical protein